MTLAINSLKVATSRSCFSRINNKIVALSGRSFSSASFRTRFDQKQTKVAHSSCSFYSNPKELIDNNLGYFSTQDDSKSFRRYDLSSPECNTTPSIASRIGTNLHHQPKHPLNTIKKIIEDYWQKRNGFKTHDNLDPIVPTMDNFDSLLIPPDHVSRGKSDTYYLDNETVLRTHTSAHQTTMLNAGQDCFLVTGDVYR